MPTNVNYGNLFDSGTGAYANAALPDAGNWGYSETVPWNDYWTGPSAGGWADEGWDENYGGYGSFGGYDPTSYNYPVGEAGGYGW